MKITKQNDHYLFKNEHGEYHLSLEQYNKLGKDKALEFVTKELDKIINDDRVQNFIRLIE